MTLTIPPIIQRKSFVLQVCVEPLCFQLGGFVLFLAISYSRSGMCENIWKTVGGPVASDIPLVFSSGADCAPAPHPHPLFMASTYLFFQSTLSTPFISSVTYVFNKSLQGTRHRAWL